MSHQPLTDFFVAFDPGADAIGEAELVARLCALVGAPPHDLDAALHALPPARLVRVLHEPASAPRRLRERLRILDRSTTTLAVAEARLRSEMNGERPVAALHAALLAHASRAPITEQERLVAEIEDARAEVLALWPAAFDAVARWGEIDQRAALSLGIGPRIWGMVSGALGRSAEERITRAEFVEICPRLVAFWPLTPQTHEAMYALLGIVRAAAQGRAWRPPTALERVN
ncbi:hypothetical protein [Salinarimonas ramus]|uniref:Uncharacterized protein n=1 Tax=Salinarimonas ramus TaxID=690164 RepID=A0A917Q9G1_9HYPH|nr:hypothetical protein [Salinarimonas ramus]GGK37197.1 hypothetical protein GCM10011322_25250 [Salinarimonas ramus]